jgi:hypothetical protein
VTATVIPLTKVPASVARATKRDRDAATQAAYERRHRARQLLFGLGGGQMTRLAPKDRQYVLMVHREAYAAYLHLYRTGESRYQGWTKRRQVRLINTVEPLRERQHWRLWYGSQKARYFRHDLPKAVHAKEPVRAH